LIYGAAVLLLGSTRIYKSVNLGLGIYWIALLYVVYSVGTPDSPLVVTSVVQLEFRTDPRLTVPVCFF
jgi:hypothetical protein